MSTFNIPTKNDVSNANQEIFDSLKEKIGMVPNLYATLAHSDNALKNVLEAGSFKSSINNKEQQIVNLAVSQVNACNYCLAAHTAMGKGAGLTDDQILEVRAGRSSINQKLDALAAFVVEVTQKRGHASDTAIAALLDSGYSRENLMDILVLIGIKTISNYVHSVTRVAIDFPAAPALEAQQAS